MRSSSTAILALSMLACSGERTAEPVAPLPPAPLGIEAPTENAAPVETEVQVLFDDMIAFDFDTNVILGDVDGSALRTLATRRLALDSCLNGLAAEIDAQGGSTSFDVAGEGGRVTRLSMWSEGAAPREACVNRAIEGLTFPASDRRYSGIVQLVPARPQSLREGHPRVWWTKEAGGLEIELHAELEPAGDDWRVRLHGVARVLTEGRSFATRPLYMNEEYSNVETITRVASWSHGEEPTADCRPAGTSIPLEATSRTISRGGYVGIELFVLAGPCGQPLETVSAGALHVHWLPGTERPYLRAVPRWRYRLESSAVQRMWFESIGAL